MKRARLMKQLGLGFAVVITVAMVFETAWADPTGPADLPQIMGGQTTGPGGARQRTFRTTDPIGFQAVYYDNAPGCAGLAPTYVQLLVFTLEGKFIGGVFGGSSAFGPGSKYRSLSLGFGSVAAVPLAPGSYRFTFVVRACDNLRAVVLPDFVTFQVFAP